MALITGTHTREELADTIEGMVEKDSASEPALQQPGSELPEQLNNNFKQGVSIESVPGQIRELSKEPEPVKPKVTLCGVCKEKPGKYKCARCYLP